MSREAISPPVPENSALKKREKKKCPAFFAKTLVLWLSRSKALLAGGKHDKIRRMSKRGKMQKKKKHTIE